MKSRKLLVYSNGIFTLHGNGNGPSTGNGTGTIGNNGFCSPPLSQTSVNISTGYYTFNLVSVPVQFPFSVTKPLHVEGLGLGFFFSMTSVFGQKSKLIFDNGSTCRLTKPNQKNSGLRRILHDVSRVYIDVNVMRCTLYFCICPRLISCNIYLSDEHLAYWEIRCVKSHCNIVADDR